MMDMLLRTYEQELQHSRALLDRVSSQHHNGSLEVSFVYWYHSFGFACRCLMWIDYQ